MGQPLVTEREPPNSSRRNFRSNISEQSRGKPFKKCISWTCLWIHMNLNVPHAVGDETFKKAALSETIKPTKPLHFSHKLGEGFHSCLLQSMRKTQQVSQQRQ